MGVTFIAPQGTYTAPAKLVSKSITENGTYDPADDNANGYSSVTVEVEGGGGSSDFSTATLTIAGLEGADIDAILPLADAENNISYASQTIGDGIYTVILYKGKALGWFDIDPEYFTISGDITMDGSDALITGDCSITAIS